MNNFMDDLRLGALIISPKNEDEFQMLYGSNWVLADGRSIPGSELERINKISIVPDLKGDHFNRYMKINIGEK